MKAAISGVILVTMIWVFTSKPEEIGTFAGKVVHSFEQARQ